MTTQPDLSHLVQEITNEPNNFEGLRSIWTRMLIIHTDKFITYRNTSNLKIKHLKLPLRDLSHLVQDITNEPNNFEGLRSIWNRMLIIHTDKFIDYRNSQNFLKIIS